MSKKHCGKPQYDAHVQTNMQKILIIRFSSIGDIVLTTPVIRCLKLQLNAEVHYLTKQSYHSILVTNPYLSRIYTIKKKVREVIQELKKERYDYVIDLHKNLRSAQVKFALTAKSFAFDKLNWEKWLLVNLKINRLPHVHIVERYLDTVKSLGVKNDGAGLDYFIEQKDELNLKDLGDNLELSPSLQLQNQQFIVFAIGAAHQTKRLPTEKIIAVCRGILENDGHFEENYRFKHIILIGGPAEAAEGEKITQAIDNQIINLCGKISINQSASLIEQSGMVISHDTGMMHIAAAFKKKIISIWGNTIPEFGMYPYYPVNKNFNTSIEVKELSCRPCSKIGHAQCPKGHFKCMKEIDVADVVKNVNFITK